MTGRETKATGRPTWIGAAELEQLRLQWRDAGQKIWDEGTRAGRSWLEPGQSLRRWAGRNSKPRPGNGITISWLRGLPRAWL